MPFIYTSSIKAQNINIQVSHQYIKIHIQLYYKESHLHRWHQYLKDNFSNDSLSKQTCVLSLMDLPSILRKAREGRFLKTVSIIILIVVRNRPLLCALPLKGLPSILSKARKGWFITTFIQCYYTHCHEEPSSSACSATNRPSQHLEQGERRMVPQDSQYYYTVLMNCPSLVLLKMLGRSISGGTHYVYFDNESSLKVTLKIILQMPPMQMIV